MALDLVLPLESLEDKMEVHGSSRKKSLCPIRSCFKEVPPLVFVKSVWCKQTGPFGCHVVDTQ